MVGREERIRVVNKVGTITIILNILLAIVKIVIGLVGNSAAIFADGFHTLSDVFSTVLAIVGVRISSKEDDKEHPYGHEKLEAIVGKLLAIFLIATGALIGWEGIKIILSGEIQKPGSIAIVAAIISIVVKEWMYRYTLKASKYIDSTALKSDAWHHRTDTFSSIGTLIGVTGAILGFTILDPLASVVVSILIIKVGVEIYMQSVKELIDTSADEETELSIENIAINIEGVKSMDLLKTRVHGNRLFVDIEIGVDGNIKVIDAHDIAENVHDELERQVPKIKHCMVHVNPYERRS